MIQAVTVNSLALSVFSACGTVHGTSYGSTWLAYSAGRSVCCSTSNALLVMVEAGQRYGLPVGLSQAIAARLVAQLLTGKLVGLVDVTDLQDVPGNDNADGKAKHAPKLRRGKVLESSDQVPGLRNTPDRHGQGNGLYQHLAGLAIGKKLIGKDNEKAKVLNHHRPRHRQPERVLGYLSQGRGEEKDDQQSIDRVAEQDPEEVPARQTPADHFGQYLKFLVVDVVRNHKI